MAHRFLDLPFVEPTTGVFLFDLEVSPASVYRNIVYLPAGGGSLTNLTNITTNGVQCKAPRLSPDGTQVAFVKNSGTGDDLYIINIDGTGSTALDTTPATSIRHLEWHPDGSKILYQVGADLFTILPDGTGKTTILSVVNLNAPAYNNDGSLIAFTRVLAVGNKDLWVCNGDGTGSTQINSNTGNGAQVAWLHASNTIIYMSGASGDNIRKIQSDGSGDTSLATSKPGYWHPYGMAEDDSYLYWTQTPAVGNWLLSRLDPTTGTVTSLGVSVPKAFTYQTAVAFDSRVYSLKDNAGSWDVISILSDGTGQRLEYDVIDTAAPFEDARISDGIS